MPKYVSVSDYIRASTQERRERQNTERGAEPATAFTTEHLDEILTRRNASDLGSLVHSIFKQESSGGRADTSQPNYAGARGPMQVTRGTFEQVKQAGLIPTDYQWENPQHSAEAGVAYVEHLRSTVGDDPERIGRAYYGGPGAVDRPEQGDPRNPNAPTVGEYGQQVASRMGAPPAQAQQPLRKWAEVATDPKFLALEPEQRESARTQYFLDVVAPHMQTLDVQQMREARAQFDADTKPSVLTQAADMAKGHGAGWITAASIGLEGIGEGLREGGQKVADVLGIDAQAVNPIAASGAPRWLQEQSKALSQTRSTGSQIKEATSTATGDITDPSTWSAGTDPSVAGYLQQGANILGQLTPTLLAAYATRGQSLRTQMATGAGIGATQSGGAGAQQAREFLAQIPEEHLAQQSPLYRKLLAQGVPSDQALAQLADESAKQAFRRNAAVGALGGAATGAVLSPALKLGGQLAAGSRVGQAALKGSAGAIEEGTQEVAEGAATIAGINEGAGMDRSLTEGSFQNAVLGAMGGGAPAAVAGALSPLQQSTQRLREATDRARRGEAVNADEMLGGVEADAPVQSVTPTLPAPADFVAGADGTTYLRGEQPSNQYAGDAEGVTRRMNEAEASQADQARLQAQIAREAQKRAEAQRRRELGLHEIREWVAFPPNSGTRGIPRAEMPQVKAEHRGALVNYLNARGVAHEQQEVAASALKATQAEYSPAKVDKAKSFTGGDRSILVSSDDYVVDGHHQWVAKLDAGENVKVIRLNAPIDTLLPMVKEFPSSTADVTIEPIRKRLFHGERADGKRLSAFPDSQGHYFTEDREVAQRYAGESGTVAEYDVEIQKPFVTDELMSYISPVRRRQLEADGYDGVVSTNPANVGWTEYVVFDRNRARQMPPQAPIYGDPDDIANQRARQARSKSQPMPPVEAPAQQVAVQPAPPKQAVELGEPTDLPGRSQKEEQASQPTEKPVVQEPPLRAVASKSPGLKRLKPRIEKAAPPDTDSRTSDVGEELTYNRRNLTRGGMDWSDIEKLNPALRVKEAAKAKIWPRPDYEAMAASGEKSKLLAHVVKQVYDSIATRPGVSKTPTDADLKDYVAAVQAVRRGVDAWLKDEDAIDRWIKSIDAHAQARVERRGSIGIMTNVSAGLIDHVFPKNSAGERFVTRHATDDGIAQQNNRRALLIGGKRTVRAVQPGVDTAADAMKAIAKGWPAAQEAWKKQGVSVEPKSGMGWRWHEQEGRFYVRFSHGKNRRSNYIRVDSRDAGEHLIASLGEYVATDKRGNVIGSAPTAEGATEIARNSVKRGKDEGVEQETIDMSAAKREGAAHRNGRDVSSEELMQQLGFRAVNFGNWMKGKANAAERQAHLNHAFDSFMDLSQLLQVPPEAMSLNGMLGIAFGAQGSGGKAVAHFVPGVNEINLTRESGAGSLAHEFGHALDHYFATQAGDRYARERVPFLSGLTRTLRDDHALRPEIKKAFQRIFTSIRERPETREEAHKRHESALSMVRANTGKWIASLRRDLEDRIKAQPADALARFDALAERVVSGDIEALSSIGELFKQSTGKKAPQLGALDGYARYLRALLDRSKSDTAHEPQSVNTDYFKNSSMKDKADAKPYWSTPHEMFARAFESFVMDALAALAARNDYLVSPIKSEKNAAIYRIYPYPRGIERKSIDESFRTLIGEIKTRKTDRGVALYSRTDKPGFSDTSSEQVAAWLAEKIAAVRGAAKVHVVKDIAELRERAFDETLPADVKGLHYSGDDEAWLVASELPSREDAETVFRHEVEGHLAVELYGDLRRAVQAAINGRDGGKLGALWRLEAREGMSEEEVAKEVIAKIAEEGIEHPLLARLITAVRNVLRKLGFELDFSEHDIRGLIAGAVRSMHSKARRAQAQERGDRDDAMARAARSQRMAAAFSRAEDSPQERGRFVMEVLSELGGIDEFFKNPATQPASLIDVVAQLSGFDVPQNDTDPSEREGAQRNVTHFTRRLKDQNGKPTGKTERVPVYIYQQGRKVWIDVSRLRHGEGGDKIYQAIADYARTTGRAFVGDPAGLSPDAVVRRTYHMLSNMIRYGDLKGFAPAKEQLEGNEALGIPKLEWTPNDPEKQFIALTRVFYATVQKHYPELADYYYDFGRGTFSDRAGRAVSARMFKGIAERGDRKISHRGRALQAGIFIDSLARLSEDRKSGLLAHVLRKPADVVRRVGRLFSRGPAVPPRVHDTAVAGGTGEAVRGRVRPAAVRGSSQHSGLIDALFKGPGKIFADKITSPLYDILIRSGGAIIPEKVKQAVVSDYGLDEPYLDAKIDRQSAINKVLRETKNLVDMIEGLSREQLRIAYLWMQEKPDSDLEEQLLTRLPVDARAPVLRMKQLVDELGQEAVKVGLLSEDSYQRNRMAYMHRMYRAHLLPGEKSTQFEQHKKNVHVRAKTYMGRGLRDDISREALPEGSRNGDMLERQEQRDAQRRLRAKRYVKAGTPLPAGWKSDGAWEVRWTEGKNAIGLWRDMTNDERERLGEIEEVRFAFANTVMKSIADIETQKFFNWVADNYAKDASGIDADKIVEPGTGYASVKSYAADEYVKVPDVEIPKTAGLKKYGALSGKLIPAVIWNDIRVTYATPDNALAQGYQKMLRAWKISKTALSPAVHTNNVMSNFILADIADVRARDVAHALQTIYRAKHGDEAAKALIARFEDSGAESGSFHAMELHNDIIKPLMQELQNEQDEGLYGQLTAAQIVALLSAGRVKDAARALGQKAGPKQIMAAGRKMIDLYRAEDSVFRLAKFMREVEAGNEDREAGKAARDAFLNYDINAPLIQAARRSVLPFIAFSYRAIPKMIETLGRKPWKLAKYAAAAKALNVLAYTMLGMSGDDEDKERRLLPEEMQGRVLGIIPRTMRMPWNGVNDAPVFLDVRRWFPAGDIVDVSGSQAAIPVPPWLSIGGPVAWLMEVLTNKSSFTGEPLVKDTDSAGETGGKIADHTFKFIAPNLPLPNPLNFVLPAGKDADGPRFIDLGPPGVDRERLQTYAWTNILRAGTGRTDSMGRESGSLTRSILSSVGVKTRDYPQDVARRGAWFELEGAIREIDKNIHDLEREAGRDGVNNHELQERLQRENRKKERAVSKYREQSGA